MTPQQIYQKLTIGCQTRFQVWNQKDQTLFYKGPLNDKQGFFTTSDGLATYRKDYKNIIKINGRELKEISNMSIKEQIKKEYQKILKEQQEETLTFEKDPIEYIIQRYPSLDATLIDLMTESYKDFLTGIYVMAPKPTTFKILLHNGQSFYLIYNPKAYIARVAGKQYHLMSLKDEEYALKAISRLLLMGIPPSTIGPGEEQNGEYDSKDEFASNMTSEPDLTDGLDDLEGEPEEGGEDLTDEPEEELQEQEEPKKKIRFRLIK